MVDSTSSEAPENWEEVCLAVRLAEGVNKRWLCADQTATLHRFSTSNASADDASSAYAPMRLPWFPGHGNRLFCRLLLDIGVGR